MKKHLKWSVIIPVFMAALLLVVSPTAALAQSDEDSATDSKPAMQGALAIVAPRIVRVGQEISMTVFLRSNQEPFAGAGVWAFTRENAETLRQEMTALKDNTSLAADEKDYEALADIHGTFIGRTGDDGKLYHTFQEEGVYVLAAIKRGYFPGSSPILIGNMQQGLTLWAPYRALVGQDVTMTVYERGTTQPVEAAGIWAITRDDVEVLKEEMAALRESASVSSDEMDYEAFIDIHGTCLGRTDERGQLVHAFREEGSYLLVTVKRGYFPGFSPIHIMTIPTSDVPRDSGEREKGVDDAVSLQEPDSEDPQAQETNEQNTY